MARVRGSFGRRAFEREVDREIEEHLALLAERFVRQGMTAEKARFAARKQFGGMTQMKNELRERSRFRLFEVILQDSGYVWRQFRRAPLFAFAAILTLALGIGANSAIFTLVDQLILRLLPVRDPQQIVRLAGQGNHYGSNMGHNVLSYTMYQTLRDQNSVFSQMMCRRAVWFTANVGSESEVLSGELVSGNYFPLLGVKAGAGRVFDASDDLHPNANPVAVLSYGYWRSRFAGRSEVIGRRILINNYPLTIVGVAQPGFEGLEPGLPTQFFVPVMMTGKLFPHDDFGNMFDQRLRWVNVYGRLKAGMTLRNAQAGLQPLFHQILQAELSGAGFAHATPYDRQQFLKMWLEVMPGGQGDSVLRRQYQQPLFLLMGVAGLVLLIACANLASLLAAKAATRQREIAIRVAIGSSRARLIQQLLTESLWLAIAGGAAGVFVAIAMVRGLLAFLPENPTGYAISAFPSATVLWFAFGASLFTGILFGLTPALQAAHSDITGVLKAQAASVTGGGTTVLFRKVLVAVQIALSLILLIGASLFIRSLATLRALNPGFQTHNVLQFEVGLDSIGYDAARAHAFYRQLESRLRGLPSVRTAAVAGNPVLDRSEWKNLITVAGHVNIPGEDISAYMNEASPGYFETLGIHLLAGRGFRESDTEKTPKVVVVNESFARHYFGEGSALGRRIGRGADPGTRTDLEIVGVVNDTDYEDLKQKAPRQVFLCAAQRNEFNTTVYLSFKGDAQSVFASARRLVHEMEPRAPILEMKTMDRQLEESLVTERMITSLSTGFSLLATALSILGLYGVMAYMITQRAREIGIRMALGALPGGVIWLVMREAVVLVALGVLAALPLALALGRFVRSELYGVQPADPLSIAGSVFLLGAVAMLAGFHSGAAGGLSGSVAGLAV